jgi:CRISPR/Cas system-associated exonuclease Cas4 (RecB family)
MTKKHALYSSSSLERLRLCPPSARLSSGIEGKTSAAAEKGTRIHALAEKLLLGVISEGSPDELEAANKYAEFIWDLTGDDELHVEVNVTEGLVIYHPSLGGSADAVIIRPDELVVCDLKTGKGIVDAEENSQLLTYCLGALNKFGWKGIRIVSLYIYQNGKVSNISYQVNRMSEWARELVKITQAADNPFETPNPGPKQCQFCRARPKCPAWNDLATASAQNDFGGKNNDLF